MKRKDISKDEAYAWNKVPDLTEKELNDIEHIQKIIQLMIHNDMKSCGRYSMKYNGYEFSVLKKEKGEEFEIDIMFTHEKGKVVQWFGTIKKYQMSLESELKEELGINIIDIPKEIPMHNVHKCIDLCIHTEVRSESFLVDNMKVSWETLSRGRHYMFNILEIPYYPFFDNEDGIVRSYHESSRPLAGDSGSEEYSE